MLEFFKTLRRGPGDYRSVFAEFGLILMFLRAERAATRRGAARLRVVQ